jgi:chorismate mutase
VTDEQLSGLREQVAETDRVLVETLNERLRLVARIKRHKSEQALPFLDPEREAWLLAYLARANRGPLSSGGLERFVEVVLELTKQELAERAEPTSLQKSRATETLRS